MKKFEDLHIDNQILLQMGVLERLGGTCNRLADVAVRDGCTVDDIWRDICDEAGLDLCEPWPGFPEPPHDLPPALGGELPTSLDQKEIGERLREIMVRFRAGLN